MAARLNPFDVVRSTTPPIDSQKMAKAPPMSKLTPERVKTLIRPLPRSPSRILYPTRRPEWWDGAHRLLRELALRNQENPLIKSEILAIEHLVGGVIANKNPVELLMLMKLLSEFIVFDTKRLFFRALAALRALKPEINECFFDIDSDDPAEGPSLSPMAINMMFRFYEEEFGYPAGILSCQPLSALPGLIRDLAASGPDQIRGWVIRNDDSQQDPHVVPIFALTYKGLTHLFIFDSLGHTISKEPKSLCIGAALASLIRQFEDRADLVIYSYKIKRQNSEFGCATFSMHDLKNLCERHIHGPGNIVDFYTTQSSEFQPRRLNEDLGVSRGLSVFEIDTLPPEMMKVTQSFKKISAYQKAPPVFSLPVPQFTRLSFDGKTHDTLQDLEALNRSVTEITRITPDGSTVNLYVEQKRFSDIVYLITRYFNKPGP